MTKHLIVLILASLVVIVVPQHIHPLITALVSAHDWISQSLAQLFSESPLGKATRQFIALLVMPLVIALIPTGVFWLARRRLYAYFIHVLWAAWLVQATALLAR